MGSESLLPEEATEMNPIELFVIEHPDMRVMDLLQDAAIISDNCVLPSEIAAADQDRALAYLQNKISPTARPG